MVHESTERSGSEEHDRLCYGRGCVRAHPGNDPGDGRGADLLKEWLLMNNRINPDEEEETEEEEEEEKEDDEESSFVAYVNSIKKRKRP